MSEVFKSKVQEFPTPAIAQKAEAALAAYREIVSAFYRPKIQDDNSLSTASMYDDLSNTRIRFSNACIRACQLGDLPAVETLIKKGADITALDYEAVEMAVFYNYPEILRLLFGTGVDISPVMLDSWIISAARGNYLDIVSLLIEKGGSVDACNSAGEIAILRAAAGDHYEVVDLLIGLGADTTPLGPYLEQKFENYQFRKKHWHQVLRRDPLPYLWREDPLLFKGTCYESVRQMLKEEGYKGEALAIMAFHTAALFQSPERVLQYLKQWGAPGAQLLHDLVHAIVVPSVSSDGVKANLKDWADGVLKCGPSMARLVKFADKVPSPVKTDDGRTWSMVKTRAECAKFSFARAGENVALAGLCFEHSVREDAFEKALAIVQEKQPANKNLPELALSGESFGMPDGKFRRLADGDIGGLFLGEMTDCCQSIGGAGAACAKHGFTSENGGFYVVENAKGRIVGQSWAWRGEQGELCLDSLETLGQNVNGDQWMGIVKAFRDALSSGRDHNVTALTIGAGGATSDSCPGLSSVFNDRVTAKPCDYNGYRDSRNQILIWRAPDV